MEINKKLFIIKYFRIWDRAMRKSWQKIKDCQIVGYKFRSSPTATFGPSHYIQEIDKIFFGPFYGTYQRYIRGKYLKHSHKPLYILFRARVAWKAKRRRKANKNWAQYQIILNFDSVQHVHVCMQIKVFLDWTSVISYESIKYC